MGRKAKYKVGHVMSWRDRGYTRYGVIVGLMSLTDRVAYTLVVTDPFGAYEGNTSVVHKWAHQISHVLSSKGNPRTSSATVRLWKEGKIG